MAAMEGDMVNRLQLLEVQVGDLQRRLDSVSREKTLEAPDMQKRLQSLEESMNLQRSSNDERLKVLSSELQQSTKTVMQQLEQHLTSLEEASKQQTQYTESTLKHLAKKVEDSLQNAALEISDAALQNILTQAEKVQKRGPLRPTPFPENRVIRQVSNEQWHEWQAQQAQQAQHVHAAHGAGVRPVSPSMVRGMSPVMSVPTLRGGPHPTASLRSLSPETMMAMAVSPRGELSGRDNRGRSSEPMMRAPIRPEMMRAPMTSVPQAGPASAHIGRLQSSPRGVPTPSGSWLRQVPAALR